MFGHVRGHAPHQPTMQTAPRLTPPYKDEDIARHHRFDCSTQSENMSELRSLEIIEALCRQLAGQFRQINNTIFLDLDVTWIRTKNNFDSGI